jgi:hypothetical protein
MRMMDSTHVSYHHTLSRWAARIANTRSARLQEATYEWHIGEKEQKEKSVAHREGRTRSLQITRERDKTPA